MIKDARLKANQGTSKMNDVDHYVSQRLKMRRNLMGISQEKLANALGVTFQQVQKYERGTNRISAGRLFELSDVLETPVSYFFEGMPSGLSPELAEDSARYDADVFTKKETQELLRYYYLIEDESQRKALIDLAKTLSSKRKA